MNQRNRITAVQDKKILYVIGSLDVGGAETHTVSVAIQLKKRGWEPEFLVLSPGGPLTSRLLNHHIPVHGVEIPRLFSGIANIGLLRKALKLIFCIPKLLKIFWDSKRAVIHFFLPRAYLIGGLISLFSPFHKRIMSRRSLNHYQVKHPIAARIEYFLHQKMDLVCGNSLAVMADLKAEGVKAERIRLIYNGVDTTRFDGVFDKATLRKNLGYLNDQLIFVIVANLIPYKGHSDLITAFSMISAQLKPGWKVLCLGRDDGIAQSLQDQASALGILENIEFLGSRPDVSDYLKMADIGILCSHEEGFSNAILECMAARLPMVVTDVGGNAEAVADQVTGYVVPAKNPTLLSEALLQVAHDDNRSVMGVRGRQRVEALFSIDACVDAYQKLYEEVLN